MIQATVFKRNESYKGFQVRGHAGYAEEGYDIYCASVSVLAINTVNALEALTGDPLEAEEKEGYLSCTFPSGLSERGNLLMDALVLGLSQISEGDGKAFVQLIVKED